MKILILTAALALGGCSSVTTVPTPTGEAGIRVSCNQMSDCYKRSAKECGPLWHIIDSSNAMKPVPQIIIVCGKGDKA